MQALNKFLFKSIHIPESYLAEHSLWLLVILCPSQNRQGYAQSLHFPFVLELLLQQGQNKSRVYIAHW